MWHTIDFVQYNNKSCLERNNIELSSINHFLFTSTMNCDFVVVKRIRNKCGVCYSNQITYKLLEKFCGNEFDIIIDSYTGYTVIRRRSNLFKLLEVI